MFKKRLIILLLCMFSFVAAAVFANSTNTPKSAGQKNTVINDSYNNASDGKKDAVIGSLYSSSGVKNSADMVSFADNEQISVILSRVDINRITVQGDKILSLNGPTGLYAAKNDNTGAAYVTLYTDIPFTLYITTVNNHSASLFVTPRSTVGKTYVFIPTSPSKTTAGFENNSVYQKLMITLIGAMINKTKLDDYTLNIPKNPKSLDFYNIATLKPITFYIGAELNGITYEAKNISDKPITLKASYFYKQGVRAVALSEQTLDPGCVGYLYEVVSKE